jgi:transposase InsO family protein
MSMVATSVLTGTRIWLAAGITDMRKGFTGLSALVQDALSSNPLCGHIFVFRGRRGDLLKVLWWFDLFSRRVIGWSMSHRLETRFVLDALQMAVDRRRPGELLVHHSDHGSQYASDAVQRFHERNGLVCSMSRKGN